MTMIEALLEAKALGWWARPCSWGIDAVPQAIAWDTGPQQNGWVFRPNVGGERPVLLPPPETLQEDWEINDPAVWVHQGFDRPGPRDLLAERHA